MYSKHLKKKPPWHDSFCSFSFLKQQQQGLKHFLTSMGDLAWRPLPKAEDPELEATKVPRKTGQRWPFLGPPLFLFFLKNLVLCSFLPFYIFFSRQVFSTRVASEVEEMTLMCWK